MEKIDYRIDKIDPKILLPREKNARYMTGDQFTRLVENVKRDGALTSSVLAHWPAGQSRPEILSGHHRTKAAIAAGVKTIDAHIITSDLTEDRKVAIQLSHNAISGQDDPSVLAELYETLDMDEKLYSGITDDDIKEFDGLDVPALTVGLPEYREVNIFFLHSELDEFRQVLERIDARVSKKRRHVNRKKPPDAFLARYEDFNAVFNTIGDIKDKWNVVNSAIAFGMLAQLAAERLDQIEAEESDG